MDWLLVEGKSSEHFIYLEVSQFFRLFFFLGSFIQAEKKLGGPQGRQSVATKVALLLLLRKTSESLVKGETKKKTGAEESSWIELWSQE